MSFLDMRKFATAYFVLLISSGSSFAQDIVNENGVFDRTLTFFDPIGQSFTASSSLITSVRVAFSVANPSSSNEPISTALLRGAGLDGEVLSSGQIILPQDLPLSSEPVGPLVDLQLGVVTAVPGNIYTFVIFVPSGSPRNSVVYGDANFYSNGQMFHGVGAISAPLPSDDVRFRINGDLLFRNGFDSFP